MTRDSAGWVPRAGLKDKDVNSESVVGPVYKPAALFHTGGVVSTRIECPYDGNDDAIILSEST